MDKKKIYFIAGGSFLAGMGFSKLCSKVNSSMKKRKIKNKANAKMSKEGEKIVNDFANDLNGKESSFFDDDE